MAVFFSLQPGMSFFCLDFGRFFWSLRTFSAIAIINGPKKTGRSASLNRKRPRRRLLHDMIWKMCIWSIKYGGGGRRDDVDMSLLCTINTLEEGTTQSVYRLYTSIKTRRRYSNRKRKEKKTKKNHRFIVTVTLLLCTNKHGGRPSHSTSRSLTYDSLADSSRHTPSVGVGKVVNTTAVFSLWDLISSLRIRCWARHGRSLNDKGTEAWKGYPEAWESSPREGTSGAEESCLV